MRVFILILSLLFVSAFAVQAQTASELATQLTDNYANKYGITLTDYQRQTIRSNYYLAITKMERIQHLQATNSMLYEQQRQKIVADAELRNSRLLTGAQMRQINAGQATSVTWPGAESTPEEPSIEEEVETMPEVVEEEMPMEETSEGEWEEEESWEEGDLGTTESTPTSTETDLLDKAVSKALRVDTTATDSSKGKKVLKKGLKFLYDELLRPAIEKKVDEPAKKEGGNE